MSEFLKKAAVSFFFLGYSPAASGTVGSAGAVLLHLGVHSLGGKRAALLVAAALFAGLSVALGKWATAFYGNPDPKPFVLDEVAGYFLCAALVGDQPLIWAVPAVFFWFRFFDVVKPFPARRLEKLRDGFGIVADDLAAACYAAVAGWISVKALSLLAQRFLAAG